MNKTSIFILLACSMLSAGAVKAQSDTARIAQNLALGEVVVTGTRNVTDIRHLPQTVTTVGRQKLTENQRVNVLPTLMEQVPGLMVTSRGMMGYGVSTGGSGGMMLRGISSGAGQVMVLIDGHPQYNGIYGHSIADAYQTMMTERVEVLRGPASLLYGSNAMGGVVNIVTRSMDADGGKGYAGIGAGSWGTVQGEAGYSLRKGKWRMTASGQYGRSDNHRPNMGFEQYGGFAKVQYDINSHWNLFADADVTHFNASYPGTVSAPMLEADQWITRGAVAVGIENHFGSTSGRLSLYDNFGRHKINDGYNALTGSQQTRLFRSNDALMGVSWYQSAVLWDGSRFTVGFDYQNIYGHAYYTSRETGEVLETQNKQSGEERNHELAGYVDLRQDLFTWLTAEAGVRFEHHSVTGGEWIPQGGIVVRPVADGELKLMASKGFRNPTMREMYLYPPSNTDLEPERMWSYELSWKQRLMRGRLQYGINLFCIDADNIIQTVNRQNVNTGKLNNKGVEFDVQYRINSHWQVNTNHSWLDMRHPVVSAPKYKGYIGVNMAYGRWSGSAGLMQVCGLYTAIAENETTEDFTLLNAIVSYAVCSPVHLWVKGENLLAQRYEYIAGMPMPKATFMAGVDVEF
ncbi:MAG: TonB-dependent receptor plug domain-containing protein [Muribaculaceae bacterium]